MIFAGLDWSEQTHCVVILDVDGQQLVCKKVEHSHNGLYELDGLFKQHAAREDVHIAVGLHDSLLIDWLVQQPYRVYGINPKSAERVRDRFTPAGLKDDQRDAWCLAEFVRTSHPHLRLLRVDSDQTLSLISSVRLREDLVQERTAQLQKLRSHLVKWHPHALKAIPDLNAKWALAFLERYPTADAFAKLTYGQIERWAKGRGLRMITIDRVGAAVQFPSPTTRSCRNEAHATHVRCRVRAMRHLNEEIANLDDKLNSLVDNHPDAVYFRSLPVRGTVTTATILAGFGGDRDRWEGHEEVAARWGVAPVTVQSGKHKNVKRRRACDTTIHQAWIWFAFKTVACEDCWARDYYRAKRKAGADHYGALRCTAQRWVKITYRMWLDRTLYDEELHQQRRAQRAGAKTKT